MAAGILSPQRRLQHAETGEFHEPVQLDESGSGYHCSSGRDGRPCHERCGCGRHLCEQYLSVNAEETTLLQFNLSSLPSGTTSSQIGSAKLCIFVNRVESSGLVSVQPV